MQSETIDALFVDSRLYGIDNIKESIVKLLKQADYLSDDEKQQLVHCCFFAACAHEGQKRRSGEPYICHPIKVAEILAKEVEFDLAVLEGAVLHDVIEDTPIEKPEVATTFGDEVAELVDGVSKLEKDKNVSPQELQARTFEKLVHAMQADPRVVMIKFADRMHNMQTLGALRPEKRRRIAQETLDVYVPIAIRLGMFNFKNELEELAFKHVHPWRYKTIYKLLQDNQIRQDTADAVSDKLNAEFKKESIKVSVRKRRRNLYEIYNKLKRVQFYRRPLENASIPFVILTDSIEDCYRALGLIHQLYTPVFKKLADYIASPKANGYQSLHTSVLTKDRRVINIQIRTKTMHTIAESGIIAIWRYHNQSKNPVGFKGVARDKSMRRWLENIKSFSNLSADPMEFYDAVKRDLGDFEMQVLTPKGEPIALPEGACVIDFAYHVHTGLGNHLTGAKVNGVEVELHHKLQDRQSVELFTNPQATPQSHWLKVVKTARARTAIRHFLKTLPDETLNRIGLAEMQRYLNRREIRYRNLETMLETVAKKQYQIEPGELLKRLALHDMKRKKILSHLRRIANEEGVMSSLAIRLFNQPGALAVTTDIMGKYQANIIRIHFPDDMQTDEVTIIFDIYVEMTPTLNNIIKELKSQPLIKTIQREET